MISEFLTAALEDVFSFGVMVVVTLAVVITIHEFGHYIAARLCGVHVETFAFGFGRELFGFGGGAGKTRWSVRLFPLGGYVKLFGDVDKNKPIVWDHENDCERTLSTDELRLAFCTKTVWQRIFIVAAGPLINVLLTVLIFFSLFTLYGQRSKLPVINALAVNSAAFAAGVQVGDRIVEMDGKPIRRLADIYDFTWYENPPQEHRYVIERDNEIVDITFKAKRLQYYNKKGVELRHGQTGMVRLIAIKLDEGVYAINGQDTKQNPDKARAIILNNLDQLLEVHIPFRGYGEIQKADPFLMSFPAAYNQHLNDPAHEHYDLAYLVDPEKEFFVRLSIVEAFSRIAFLMKDGVVNSYKVIDAAFAGRNKDPVVGGVAKISQSTGNAVEAGWYSYLMFVGIFSFMIAIINLLPIPALDGGYLVFLLYELISGRTISPRIQDLALIVGLAILLGIMIFANISDFLTLLFPI